MLINLIKYSITNLLLFATSVVYADSYLKILYIADSTSTINGTSYLYAKNTPSDSLVLFPYNIDGFNYETGFEYCILVDVISTTQNEDASVTKYVLNDIKYKKKTVQNAIPKSAFQDSSKWMLYKLKMKDGTKTFSISKAYIQFDIVNNTINGNTDCNTFHADFTEDTTTLQLKNIITTKMACSKRAIEPTFINMLHNTTHFAIKSKLLYVYQHKKLLAIFIRKK